MCVCVCVCVCVCACVCVGGQDGVRYSVVAGYAYISSHAMVLLQGSEMFFLQKSFCELSTPGYWIVCLSADEFI